MTYVAIAERVGLSKSAVGRICQQADLARLPPLEAKPPGPRYERERPGQLLHIGTKKPPRFSQPGHRVTADRTKKTCKAGQQALRVCIDEHSRVGFSQLLVDETAHSACEFLLAALRYHRQFLLLPQFRRQSCGVGALLALLRLASATLRDRTSSSRLQTWR